MPAILQYKASTSFMSALPDKPLPAFFITVLKLGKGMIVQGGWRMVK